MFEKLIKFVVEQSSVEKKTEKSERKRLTPLQKRVIILRSREIRRMKDRINR